MRESVWVNEVSLWRDAAQHSEKPRPWLNLGSALMKAQRYDEARSAITTGAEWIDHRPTDERRVSDAYHQALEVQWLLLNAQWSEARVRASELNERTRRLWRPAIELCHQLTC